jgi:hypothetical protein
MELPLARVLHQRITEEKHYMSKKGLVWLGMGARTERNSTHIATGAVAAWHASSA